MLEMKLNRNGGYHFQRFYIYKVCYNITTFATEIRIKSRT